MLGNRALRFVSCRMRDSGTVCAIRPRLKRLAQLRKRHQSRTGSRMNCYGDLLQLFRTATPHVLLLVVSLSYCLMTIFTFASINQSTKNDRHLTKSPPTPIPQLTSQMPAFIGQTEGSSIASALLTSLTGRRDGQEDTCSTDDECTSLTSEQG